MRIDLLRSAELNLFLEETEAGEGSALVIEGKPSARFGLALFRLIRSGPEMTLGTTLTLDESGSSRVPILGSLRDGLYVAVAAPPPTNDQLAFPAFKPPPEGNAFWVGPDAPANLSVAVQSAMVEQNNFENCEVRQAGYEGSERQLLHILLDGCLLDHPQTFEGGRLSPLQRRMRVGSIIEVVNALLPPGVAFEDFGLLNERYGRDHPLSLVTFVNVVAENDQAAIVSIQPRLQRVLGALTLDRGANPSPIAYIIERPGPTFNLRLSHSSYSGNLVPGFGPGVTSLVNQVEEVSRTDPWTEFALGLFRSIRSQPDPSAQLFQCWAMIEAAAKRRIPKNSGNPVYNEDGEKVATQGSDFGRVIVYLRDTIGTGRLGSITMPGSLYERVTHLYRARNRIAHEGGIDSPANLGPKLDVHALAWMAKDWAEAILRFELVTIAALSP